jgi:hypothetical protein
LVFVEEERRKLDNTHPGNDLRRVGGEKTWWIKGGILRM